MLSGPEGRRRTPSPWCPQCTALVGGAVIGEDSHRIFEISLSSPLEMRLANIDEISEVFSFPPSFHKVWRQDRIQSLIGYI